MTESSLPTLPSSAMQRLLDRYPVQYASMVVNGASRRIAYREGGRPDGLPLVLLHGIGAGAAAWLPLFPLLSDYRVMAWDAPGYGDSSPVDDVSPVAADYAAVLNAWLATLKIEQATVVAHSLGAVMAGAALRGAANASTPSSTHASNAPGRSRIVALQLVSPAAGYGAADPSVREQKLQTRLALLDTLGVEGMARERSAALCGPSASTAARDWVRWNMARVNVPGYRQASHLLANADLASDLAACVADNAALSPDTAVALAVGVGSEDKVTTPASCAVLAAAAAVPLTTIAGLGHACYMESPEQLSALIAAFVASVHTVAHVQPSSH